jgi:trans-aconitate 2-methyltransferase
MWNFATPEETEERLRNAGFAEVRCWLEDKPVQPEDPYAFTTTVTMGPHLGRLPEEKRRPFAEAVLELEDEPLTLNYVRLNIEARKPE